MRNLQFHLGRLRRIIDLQGVEYTFYRKNKDDLGEPIEPPQELITLKGVWHESHGYVTTTSGDAATVRSKPQVQILALYGSQGDLSQGDYLILGNTQYLVTGVHDLTNLKLAVDISLEEVI